MAEHLKFTTKTGVAVSVTKTAQRDLLTVSDSTLPFFALEPDELRDLAKAVGEEWVKIRTQQIEQTGVATQRPGVPSARN